MRYVSPDTTDIDEALSITLRMLAAANEMHLSYAYPGFLPYTFGYDKGKKYNRVWVQHWQMPSYCPECRVKANDALGQVPYEPVECFHDKEPEKGQRFVCFFVQRDNGDVWKAGGWKAPALNFTRGNILSPEGRKAITFDKLGDSLHFYPGF